MNDCIKRKDAVTSIMAHNGKSEQLKALERMPSVQNSIIIRIKSEIEQLKKHVSFEDQSDRFKYGYMSALSTVEAILAAVEEN